MREQLAVFTFSDTTYWEARLRQGNCCASCGDDLQDLPRHSAPAHHVAITVQEASVLRMQKHPDWIRSSENCAVVCQDCHREFAHDGGHFRTRLEEPTDYRLVQNDLRASRELAQKQAIAFQNIQASHLPASSRDLQNGNLAMPTFDERNKDQTRDNLFGADAGPKGELGPAKQAGGGQGDTNENKKEQSLQDLQAPKQFGISLNDFQKTIQNEYRKELANEQQNTQQQSTDKAPEQELKLPPPQPKHEHKH